MATGAVLKDNLWAAFAQEWDVNDKKTPNAPH